MSEDDERLRLLRAVEQGDESVVPRIQAMNDRLGLQAADADYLKAYIDICERLMDSNISQEAATKELGELNNIYRLKICAKTLRSDVAFANKFAKDYRNYVFTDEDGIKDIDHYEHWVPSQIC